MKKALTIMLITVLAVSFVFAQDEAVKMDAGLRGGWRSGVTGRYFLSESNCTEVLLTSRGWSGLILTGMYQWHKPLSLGEIENLSWFFGGGLHVGYWVSGSVYGSDLALGVDAIAGVEYDLEPLIEFPLSVSLDYKPGFDIFGKWAGTFADVAMSVRYTF